MKAIISFPNDPNVGIPSTTYEMDLPFANDEWVTFTKEQKDDIKQMIINLYTDLEDTGFDCVVDMINEDNGLEYMWCRVQ